MHSNRKQSQPTSDESIYNINHYNNIISNRYSNKLNSSDVIGAIGHPVPRVRRVVSGRASGV
jgi:hypothetical protein